MGENLNKTFTFEQLKSFFKQYPIKNRSEGRFFYDCDETDVYLFGFKHFAETGEDVMQEYFKIKRILMYHPETIGVFSGHYYHDVTHINKYIEELMFILNYKGTWNIDYLMNKFGCTRDKLEKDLKEILDGFPAANKEKMEKRQEEQNEYIERYYSAERVLEKEEINDFFKNKIEKCFKNKKDKDLIDIRKIKYPIVLFLFKDNKMISIHKVKSNLEQSMSNYKKTKKFDSYSYLYVDEKSIEEIFAESIVRYNPNNLNTNTISLSNPIYRTLNQIKIRYKGIKEIDLRVIKKVINIYELTTYNLNNGSIVVDKDLFDKALNSYYKGGE